MSVRPPAPRPRRGRPWWTAPACAALALLLTSCSELEYLRQKTERQDMTLDEMRKNLQQWEDAYTSLKRERDKENQESQKQLTLRDQEIRSLRSEKTGRERSLELAQNELKLRMQDEIDKGLKTTKQAQTAQAQATALDTELKSSKGTQAKLEKDLADTNAKLAALTTQAATTDKARQAADKRVKALEAERDQLKGTIEEKDKKLAELERGVADLKLAVKAAGDSKTSVSAQVADVRKQLAEERRSAENDRQKLKTEIARLTRELSKARGGTAPPASDAGLLTAQQAFEKILAPELKARTAELIAAPDRVVVRLLSDSVFQPATLQFRDTAAQRLRQLADVLARYPDYALLVEGHTDNQPVREMPFPDNLALSSQRASNVLRFLMESAKLPEKQLRSIGCADREPVASNDTPDGRGRNRRIEIILTRAE